MYRKMPLPGMKVPLILGMAALVLLGCRPDIEVWLSNQTQDNFRVNENGDHLLQGKQEFYTVLDEKRMPSTSFLLCRSYGCLVRVSIRGEEWPNRDQGEVSLKDVVVIEEPEWSVFTAYTVTGVTTAAIVEEECYDGIDNDNDGDPDNNDSDCVPQAP